VVILLGVRWLRRVEDYPYFDNAGLPLAFAHRGGALLEASVGLENSMLAFEAAIDLGFRYVETDVNATADGVLLALHDKRLDRVSDLAGVVAKLPYEQVRKARLGGREPIPRLSEVLTSWPDLRLNIDCKSPGAMEPLARVIEEHQAWDRVCLASFSMTSLSRLRRRLGPRVATSYGKAGIAALRAMPLSSLRRVAVGHSALAAQVPPSWLGIRVLTDGFLERAHALGKHVHVWTIDDPLEMHLPPGRPARRVPGPGNLAHLGPSRGLSPSATGHTRSPRGLRRISVRQGIIVRCRRVE
jgi:glycerophosphoryl diester phosphodiesterase